MLTGNSQSGRIWLIGGTSESAEIAKAIASDCFPCTITVTTATAKSLYPKTSLFKIVVGRMDVSQILAFLQQEQITAVVDASHPYAVAISQNAIAATTQLNLPYLRYERPTIQEDEDTTVIKLESFEA
ncbi:MAG: precorrin-6A/cobalt-precorrin-6A reductase, partial [Cyanobacteriota bacterium]